MCCSVHFFISAVSRWISEQNIWIKLNSGTKSNIGILHSMTLWSSQIHGSTSLFHLPRMESQNVRRKSLSWSTRHSGISKKITKPFLLGLLIATHKTKANIFAQPSSRAFTEYTHCVRPSLAFHIKAVPVHKGGFSTPVKKILLLLKIWRCQGCIVYKVYRVIWVVFLFWYWNSEPGKKRFQPVQVFSYGKLSVIPFPAFLQSSIFHANVCACMRHAINVFVAW